MERHDEGVIEYAAGLKDAAASRRAFEHVNTQIPACGRIRDLINLFAETGYDCRRTLPPEA
jgi:hypothetical protein